MRYLIDFKNDTTQSDIDSYMQSNSCTVVQNFNNFDKTFLVDCNTMPATTDIIEAIIEDTADAMKLLGDTYNLSDQIEISTFAIQDPKNWWKSYTFTGVDFDALEGSFLRNGRTAKVYVVDSGIDKDHPEFKGRRIELLHSFMGDDFIDRNGHGTAMASVISGNTCGITDSIIKVVKIFDPARKIILSEMLVAFDAIINDHLKYANQLKNVSVVNISWSVAKNTWLENKISTIIDLGICVVAAAGNDGSPLADITPACMPQVITVGAYNEDLTPCDFSNYTGQSVISYTGGTVNYGQLDIWAPGNNIWTAVPGGNYGYSVGTSVAAAIETAAMASILSAVSYMQAQGPGFLEFVPSTVDRFYNVRSNILILENEYAECINMITTLRLMDDYKETQNTILYYSQQPSSKLILFANQDFSRMILNPNQWKSITFDKPLLPGLQFVNGDLTGRITLEPEEQYQKHTYTVTLIDKDDIEIVQTFDVVVWHDMTSFTTSIMNDPALKEELDVELAAFCDNGQCFAAYEGTPGYCGCCVNIYGLYYNKTYGVPAGRCFCYYICP